MKQIFIILVCLILSLDFYAQTSPLGPVCTFNYQAVARNADDNVMSNQNVTIIFTILDGPGGNELHIERHETTTSSLGLINLEVGAGERIGGSLAFIAIPWGIRKHYLRVEMEVEGSGNLINIGEAPILAVPIAIQAKVASFAVSTLDTIKMIDTLRVDTIRVGKLFADNICPDTIRGKIAIIDTMDALKLFANDICTDTATVGLVFSDTILSNKIYLNDGSLCVVKYDTIGNIVIPSFTSGINVNDAGIYGAQFTSEGKAGLFDGNVEISGGGLNMTDVFGKTVFSVDEDGNSFHKGHEVFAGGLSLVNLDQLTILSIDPEADPFSDYAFNLTGNAMINGILQAEVKNFVIDHPLDPENMTLRHYSIESDQMGTMYNGTVPFDENGEAWVELPRWFEALNTDFSYQLTCIGGFSNVYIAEEIENNKFKIGGGKSGMKVSWQVNGVRHDSNSIKHLKPIEEYKEEVMRSN